jgi:hypothetical protein
MIMKHNLVPAMAALLYASLVAIPLAAAQESTRVKFSAGNDNAAVEGVVKGNAYHDYLLGAKAGQNMSVSLITQGSASFNILPPGSNDVAIYNSSVNGNDATGIALLADGDYKIRVYLMGNDKDTGKTVKYMVSVVIMGN